MSETTNTATSVAISDSASAVMAVSAPPAAGVKESLIAHLKAEIITKLEELERATGVVLTEARAEFEHVGADAETFWDEVKAWAQKHL